MSLDQEENFSFNTAAAGEQQALGAPGEAQPSASADGQCATRQPLAEAARAEVTHKLALTVDVQTSRGEPSRGAITCPSRLQAAGSPRKPEATFDPFGAAEDDAGVTPLPRFLSLSQPVAPRKVLNSPLPTSKLFPEKPHSCPPGGAGKRATRQVVRVRVKRSLELAANRGPAGGGGAAPAGSALEEQQQAADGGPGQLLGAVRKRSELFSPPVARKFSRSMEDIVAADLVSKLQLAGQSYLQQPPWALGRAPGLQLGGVLAQRAAAAGAVPAGGPALAQHEPAAWPAAQHGAGVEPADAMQL